jgi:hypothetical protein
MTSDSTAPQLTVQGILFTMPGTPRYSEGHVLTAVEASVLNQTFAENLRNNWAGKLKAKLEAAAPGVGVADLPEDIISALQSEFTAYAEGYTFGYRTPRVQLDPVEHLARKLAKDLVVGALRKNGIDLKTVTKEKMEEYVSSLVEKRPDIRKEAAKRLKTQKAMAESILNDIGGGEAEAEAEAA